jgi:hypothetical protein
MDKIHHYPEAELSHDLELTAIANSLKNVEFWLIGANISIGVALGRCWVDRRLESGVA